MQNESTQHAPKGSPVLHVLQLRGTMLKKIRVLEVRQKNIYIENMLKNTSLPNGISKNIFWSPVFIEVRCRKEFDKD